MTWSRWRPSDPDGLTRYVLVSRTRELIQIPPVNDRPATDRLSEIYSQFSDAGVVYGHEPPSSEPGLQAVRPPDQVLGPPCQATCLDLAVTFSAACLAAGLHPLICLLDADGDRSPHALVAVWVGREGLDQPADTNWMGERRPGSAWRFGRTGPARLRSEIADLGVRTSTTGDGELIAVDVAMSAKGYLSADEPRPFDEAIRSGSAMAREALVSGHLTAVDIGTGWTELDELWPGYAWSAADGPPLQAPFIDPCSQPTLAPTRLTRAEYRITPFQRSDHFEALLDFCTAPDDGPGVIRLPVLTGSGGAGKTRLAAELADSLQSDGWYAGFLPRHAGGASIDHLAAIGAPLMVVVDYAEARPTSELAALVSRLNSRPSTAPTVILLTARMGGEWWEQLEDSCAKAGVSHLPLLLDQLPARHERAQRVWKAAVDGFRAYRGQTPIEKDLPSITRDWTTLDLVLLAWLVVWADEPVPSTRSDLYRDILRHEYDYWTDFDGTPTLKRPLWESVAATLTVFSPDTEGLARRLIAATDDSLGTDTVRLVADGFADLWAGGWSPSFERTEGLALKPDRLGDFLVRESLGKAPALIGKLFAAAISNEDDDDDRVVALIDGTLANLARAETDAPVEDVPVVTALFVAASRSSEKVRDRLLGPAIRGSVAAADAISVLLGDGDPAFVRRVARDLPLGHSTLRIVAARAAELTAATEADDPALRASDLDTLGLRLSEAGRRDEALAPTQKAVETYQALADANPAAYLPDLAGSLNNLGAMLSEAGRRDEALAPTQKAVEIRQALADANPAAYLPDLAGSLNNLGVRLSEAGRRDEALEAWATAAEALSDPAARGWLLAVRAQLALDDPSVGNPRELAEESARLLDDGDSPAVPRGRQSVRAVIARLDPPEPIQGLPTWAWVDIPEVINEFAAAWSQVDGWPTEATLLRDHRGLLESTTGSLGLEALAALNLGTGFSRRATDLLERMAADGFETYMTERTTQHEIARSLNDWLATPTWGASQAYWDEHASLLRGDTARELLASAAREPIARQHLALLELLDTMGPTEVFTWAQDSQAALDGAHSLIGDGQMSALPALLTLNPQITAHRPHGLLVLAVMLESDGNGPDAAGIVEQALADVSAVALRVAEGRLRRWAARTDAVGSAASTILDLVVAAGEGTNSVE